MSRTDIIIEVHCQAEIYSGRFQRIPIGAVRVIQKVRGDVRQFAVRFYESATAKASEFCYERSLDPEIGRWTITRSPILPGFEYKLAYTFVEETSEKPIEVFVRPGCRRIDKLVNLLKSFREDPNPDLRPGKRRHDPMEETLPPVHKDMGQSFKRRPFGVGLLDSFTPNRQPGKSTPMSAPARIPSRDATPKTPSRKPNTDYLSMTISGRSKSDPGFCRNLSQTLNFDEDVGDRAEPPSTPSKSGRVSPRAEFSPARVPPKGGLRNIGNSCYMNACISALAKTDCWVKMLLAMPIGIKEEDSGNPISLSEDDRDDNPSVLAAVVDILRNLQRGGSDDGAASEMAHLRQSLGRYHSQFANRAQQDAHEFLSGLMDKIEDEANRMKLGMNLMSCISSTISNQICCQRCNYSRSKSEQCWNFSLNLPELPNESDCEPRHCPEHGQQQLLVAKTIENRGRQFWACRSASKCTLLPFKWGPETVSASSSVAVLFSKYFDRHALEYRCERCPSNQATLESRISLPPKVLILHLKRFHSNLQTNQCTKRNDPVSVELHLDISEFCLDERIRELGAKYRLRSVISHIGLQLGNGHYVHDHRDHQTNVWTRYDDSSVKSFAEQEVLETAKTQAYLLFYDLDDD